MVANEIPQTSGQTFAVTSPLHVLCVEDNADDRALFFRIARELYAEEEVNTLRDALVRLSTKIYDAIVLDLCLPNGKGLELFATVRGAAPIETAIVILTGHDDAEQGRELIAKGVDAIYYKGHVAESPTALLSFTQAIQSAVEKRRRTQADQAAAQQLLDTSKQIQREMEDDKGRVRGKGG